MGRANDLRNEGEQVGTELIRAIKVGRDCLSKKEMVPVEMLADRLWSFCGMSEKELAQVVAGCKNLAGAADCKRPVLTFDQKLQTQYDALVARSVAQLIVNFDHHRMASQEEKNAASCHAKFFNVPNDRIIMIRIYCVIVRGRSKYQASVPAILPQLVE